MRVALATHSMSVTGANRFQAEWSRTQTLSPVFTILDPGAGLEALEIGEHEHQSQLSGLDGMTQRGLQDIAVVLEAEFAGCSQPYRSLWHVLDRFDHGLSLLEWRV